MESPEEREFDILGRVTREHGEAVAAARSGAWSYLLLSLLLLGLAGVIAARWWPGGAVLAFMLAFLVFTFQVVLGNNFRAYTPECRADGFQPAQRRYLEALLGRPPQRRLWADVISVETNRFPDDYVITALRSRPRVLTIHDRDGTTHKLYRASYPEVFDRCLAALVARGLVPGNAGGAAAVGLANS